MEMWGTEIVTEAKAKKIRVSDALENVHAIAKRMWRWDDMTPIDACLAVAITAKTAEIPAWIVVVAPASSGKTELLSCIQNALGNEAIAFDKITPAAFVSGLGEGENDLLPLMNERTVFIKDLSPLLEMNAAERNSIIGDLRSIYDGAFIRAFAKRGIVKYETRFNLIAAATPAWESYYAVQGQLGQRFLQVRLPDTEAMLPDESTVSRETLRKELTEAIRAYVAIKEPRKIPDEERKRLFRIASRLALLRGIVPRDGSKAVSGVPEVEGPYRIYRQLCVIASGSTVETARGVADGGVPAVRARTLAAIEALGKNATTNRIAEETQMARTPTERYLEDLTTLGVVEESGEHKPYRYRIVSMNGD